MKAAALAMLLHTTNPAPGSETANERSGGPGSVATALTEKLIFAPDPPASSALRQPPGDPECLDRAIRRRQVPAHALLGLRHIPPPLSLTQGAGTLGSPLRAGAQPAHRASTIIPRPAV